MLFAPVRGSVFDFPMSYPGYNPFSYSNPPTPQGFNWDGQDSVSTSVSTPQDVQAISPIVFQHHLSPVDSNATTPLVPEPALPPAPTPAPAPAPLPIPQPPVYEAPRTIQLQERAARNHYRFDNIDESHFRNAEKRKASSAADGDEMPSSTRPSSAGAGPSRVPHGRAHAQSHPYRRPHTATSPVGSASAPGAHAAAVRESASSLPPTSRRTSSSAPRADEPQVLVYERSSQMRTGVTPFAVPAVGSGKAVSCPAMSVWRQRTVTSDARSDTQGLGAERGDGVTNRYADPFVLSAVLGESSCRASFLPALSARSSTAHDPTSPADLQVAQLPPATVMTPHTTGPSMATATKRYGIRADVHFDAASNEMTVMLELPGLKKSDIHIVMNVCPYSRVRQLTISGRSRSPLPPGVYQVQERKFGDFSRVVALPMDSKVSVGFVAACRVSYRP